MFNGFSFQSAPAADLPVSELQYAARLGYVGETRAIFGDTLVIQDVGNYGGPNRFYDISDPMNPADLGASVPGYRDEFSVDEERDLVATVSDYAQLDLYDVADPSSPALLYRGNPTDSDDYGALALGGGVLLIQSGDSGDRHSYLFDVSDPTSPVRLDKINIEGDQCGVAYPYGYLMGYGDFYAYDLSGGAFSQVGAVWVTSSYGEARHDRSTGVVSIFDYGDDEVALIDWSDKTNPTFQANYVPAARGYCTPVGDRLWMAAGSKLEEVDISDLANPEKVNEWTFRQCDDPDSSLLYHRGVLFNGYLDDYQHVQPMRLPTLETTVVSASTVRTGDVHADAVGVSGRAAVGQLDAGGALTSKAGQRPRRRSVAADAEVSGADFYVGVTDTTSARTITLQPPRTQTREHIIKDESGGAGTNAITVATSGAGTIDGATSVQVATNYGSVHLISDGTNWFTV
jgi:hypothetical protein